MTAKEFTEIQAALGLSDIELAEKLGVNRATVWRWRSGSKKIEKMTELALRYLLSGASRKVTSR